MNSYRLVTFLEEGRMRISRYVDRPSLMKAMADADREGHAALALEVLEMVRGGDEGGTVTRRRRTR